MLVNINKLIEFSIENYLSGNPFSVLSISLSELRVEVGLNKEDVNSQKYIESILLNVSGRLLMFQRDKNSPLLAAKNIKKIKTVINYRFALNSLVLLFFFSSSRFHFVHQ